MKENVTIIMDRFKNMLSLQKAVFRIVMINKRKINQYKKTLLCFSVLVSMLIVMYSCEFNIKENGSVKDDHAPSDGHAGNMKYENTLISDNPIDYGEILPTAYLNELDIPDFMHASIRIAAYDGSYVFSSQDNDPLHDAVNDRNLLAMEKLGAFITEIKIEPAVFFDTIANQYNSGISSCDMLVIPYSLMPAFVANDMLMNAKSLRYTDYSKPYFDQNAMNSLTPGRMVYGVIGDYTFSPDKYWCTFYNKDLAKAIGLRDPSELFDQNAWNWETALLYAKNASARGYTAMTASGDDNTFCDMVWASSGIQLIENEIPYAPQMCYNTNEAKELIKFIKNSFFSKNDTFVSEDSTISGALELFKEGRTLFCFSRSSSISHLNSVGFEWGIIPLPYYTSSDTASSYVDTSAQAVFFLNDIPDTDLTGAAIQTLSAASAGKLRKAYLDLTMNYYLRDNKSALIFDKIFDRAYYDMGYMLGPSIVDVATATVDIIHNTVFLNLNFKDLYNQSIVAFNERYSHRDFFSVEKLDFEAE